MVLKTVPDDRSDNAETLAEFRCCSRHSQISTFRRTETGSTREIRRQYAHVLEMPPRIQLNARNAILYRIFRKTRCCRHLGITAECA